MIEISPATIEQYFDKLFPICRSITGNGVRQTIDILKEISDNDYSNWHCVYNNKRILNNRIREYNNTY
jgi:aminopeptidase-like protein